MDEEIATSENKTETAEKPAVTAKDMKSLLALLLDATINDKEKIPFEKAKKIIEIIFSRSGDGGDDTESPEEEEEEEEEEEVERERMIESKLKDSGRMEDLGLGRGVDATKPHPWQSKSSTQVRIINEDCKNIIGTEESGQREYYEDEVNSVLTQQLKTSLTIQEPSNTLSIGVEAEKSRSFTDTRKAVGEKVMTRTVSFRTNIDENETLEKELSKFILDRLHTRQKWEKDGEKIAALDEEKVANNHLQYLRELIHKLHKQSDELQHILWYCYDFIEHLGVTHYVHTIKLGAARYRVLTTEEYYSKLEGSVQTGFEVNKVAKAEVKSSAGRTKKDTHKLTQLSEIGRIKDDHTVEMKSPDEAVLEVELKPLHSLIRTRALQLAVKWALERYIRRRESRREGPFLISCGSEKPIYWHIVKSKVMGTTEREQASLFYIISTDDESHPHEFFIGYVGDDMAALQLPKGPTNPISKVKQLAPIPQYVTAELNIHGQCDGPLDVSSGAEINRARFSLHSSVLRKSAPFRTSVDTGKWAEGGGCFINCTRRRFKRDGYIAMTTAGNVNSMEGTESKGATPSFKTSCVTSTTMHNSQGLWTVFRLLPGEHKELGKKPLEDFFYLRDDRDFQYLFGELDGKATPTGEKDTTTEKSSETKKAPITLNQQTEVTAEIHEAHT